VIVGNFQVVWSRDFPVVWYDRVVLVSSAEVLKLLQSLVLIFFFFSRGCGSLVFLMLKKKC
jgi:hypothetical protein